MKIKARYLILVAILILGFALRLYKIHNPVADWHSWRQADTSAVTRNFVKYGIDLLHPRYDDFSDVSGKGLFNPHGYRFVEFPIFNLIHYFLFRLYPRLTLEVWGRLTSVLAALVSAVFLFAYVSRRTRPGIGLLSAFFYLTLPYNIYFTRTILPDPLMVTFVLAGIYYFDNWFTKSRRLDLVLGIVACTAAILVKPPAVFFLLPIPYLAWKKYGLKAFKKFYLYLAGFIIILPFIAWRIWMLRYPEGIPASGWLLNGNHIRFKGAFFQWLFGQRLGDLILGNWGLIPFGAGLIAAIGLAPEFLIWFLSSLIYLTVFATGNIQHDYYQIGIIPSVAILLAIGTHSLFVSRGSFFQKIARGALALVSLAFMFAFGWYAVRGDYQVNHWEIVHAGQAVDHLVPKDAHVVAPYLGDTAFLYQTNRDGFPYMVMPIKDMIDRFNITYYVSTNFDNQTNAIMKKYTVTEKTPEFVIVKLVEPKRP